MSTLETAMSALETAAPPASVAGAVATPPAPPTGTVVEEPKVPPVEGQPETPETPSTTAIAEPEAEVNLDEVPEGSGDFAKYKDLLKAHPELAPELKQIIGREKAFSELAPNGSFTEMREILTRIPSLDDAEQLVADSENHRTLAKTFREDAATFVESLKDSDPLAFQKFATELPDVLAQTDEKLYSEQARVYSNRVLTNLDIIAANSGNADLQQAVRMVAQALGARLGVEQQQAPRQASEASRLRKQIEERDQKDAEAAFSSFWDQTDRVVIDHSVSSIEASIKKALPSATQAQLQRMVNEAYEKTLQLLNAQPQTISQINTYRENAKRGKQGIADHKAIVSYITGRTNLVIPKAVKGVIDEWSGQVLKLNTESIEKRQALAAKTKDVGSGPQGTTSAAGPASAGNGKARHINDILSEIATGNYKPK